ncbi:hypothetical protein, partial [Pseudomonas syringae group genomosp. 3]|uniref:hypothetical protein n=1 Tax=Pseudomonas syringae group genomosp. 3 TaxID=251701 RepID=UPI001C3F3871
MANATPAIFLIGTTMSKRPSAGGALKAICGKRGVGLVGRGSNTCAGSLHDFVYTSHQTKN